MQKEKLEYFRLITFPKIMWYATGMFVWDEMYSYYHLNIMGRKEYWTDADSEDCFVAKYFCRYCGKGKRHYNNLKKK